MDMNNLPLEARLVLEWMNAYGERSVSRLSRLVDHFCEANAIADQETRDAIFEAAAEYLLRKGG